MHFSSIISSFIQSSLDFDKFFVFLESLIVACSCFESCSLALFTLVHELSKFKKTNDTIKIVCLFIFNFYLYNINNIVLY